MAARGLTRIPAQIKQRDIATLHSSFLEASSRFSSYNFREYFVRRSNIKFQDELPSLLGYKHIDDTALLNVNDHTKHKLFDWWTSSLNELAVLERASLMNRLFEGPKLVVEAAPNLVSDQPSIKSKEDSKTSGKSNARND